jgi:hypothetical protein
MLRIAAHIESTTKRFGASVAIYPCTSALRSSPAFAKLPRNLDQRRAGP